MTQQLPPQPASVRPPASNALIMAAFPAGMGVVLMLSAFVNYGFGLDGLVIALFENLLMQCVFATGAFVVLAFVKPPRLDRSVRALTAPVLIAGGVGTVALLVYWLIYLGIRSPLDHGVTHSLNVGGLLANAILLTVALALGAVLVRARLWPGELATGASARQNTTIDALIIAGLVLVEFIVPGILTGLFYLFMGGAGGFFGIVAFGSYFGPEVLRGVLVSGVVLVVLAVIRPLSRVRSMSSVIVTALVVVGASFGVMVVVQLIVLAVEGTLHDVFFYVFFTLLWAAVDTGILVALAMFVILALRGERALTGARGAQSVPGMPGAPGFPPR